jgi:hypothetical protein
VYDQKDLRMLERLARVWQLRQRMSFNEIKQALGPDSGNPGQLVTGYNCRPYLAQMYLNHRKLSGLRTGRKWILETTPTPTNPYPKAWRVPAQISSFSDVVDFLSQFRPVANSNPNLSFFGVTSEWVETHRAELFGFLLGFLVGDGGKYYPEYERRSRHNRKSAMITIMSLTDSNLRLLRYVQLALETLGLQSHQVRSNRPVIRWNSDSSNIVTWIIRSCIGLSEGERTSTHKVNMEWLLNCPRNLTVAFLQGLSDSDGNVEKHGYYADISSVPNSLFYQELFNKIGIKARVHPKKKPQQVRVLLKAAIDMPFFDQTIRSYRYEELIQHGIRRKLIPPPPSFF